MGNACKISKGFLASDKILLLAMKVTSDDLYFYFTPSPDGVGIGPHMLVCMRSSMLDARVRSAVEILL